jgi:hypothetical protein
MGLNVRSQCTPCCIQDATATRGVLSRRALLCYLQVVGEQHKLVEGHMRNFNLINGAAEVRCYGPCEWSGVVCSASSAAALS